MRCKDHGQTRRWGLSHYPESGQSWLRNNDIGVLQCRWYRTWWEKRGCTTKGFFVIWCFAPAPEKRKERRISHTTRPYIELEEKQGKSAWNPQPACQYWWGAQLVVRYHDQLQSTTPSISLARWLHWRVPLTMRWLGSNHQPITYGRPWIGYKPG